MDPRRFAISNLSVLNDQRFLGSTGVPFIDPGSVASGLSHTSPARMAGIGAGYWPYYSSYGSSYWPYYAPYYSAYGNPYYTELVQRYYPLADAWWQQLRQLENVARLGALGVAY